MFTPPERIVAAKTWGTVEWAIDERAGLPARDFYNSLGAKDRAKGTALFDRLAQFGEIRNREKFKKVVAFQDLSTQVFRSIPPWSSIGTAI